MNRIIPQIQNGGGRLILSDTILVDLRETAYFDIPTTNGVPYRIQLKFQLDNNLMTPSSSQVLVFNEYLLEVLFTFGPSLSSMMSGSRVPTEIFIAGRKYFVLLIASRVFDLSGRVEISLYEV